MNRLDFFALLAFMMGLLTTSVPVAQAPSPDPAFELASVKPNNSGQRNSSINAQPNGRFSATNVTLLQLLARAYGLQAFRVIDAPGWAGSERFDIEAKSQDSVTEIKSETTAARLSLMLRSLLNERFMLTAHMETRKSPVYALVVARDDKRLGPQITPSAIDCRALTATRSKGIPEPAPSPGGRRPCTMSMAAGRILAGSMLIPDLATQLSVALQVAVADRTGLTGRFDFELLYAAEVAAGGVVTNAPGPWSGDSDRPSLFTALQEQLGLKLESTKGPVDVLVIDHVERPTPD
jgi:uncharacterized protein (TIGR03435 family)